MLYMNDVRHYFVHTLVVNCIEDFGLGPKLDAEFIT